MIVRVVVRAVKEAGEASLITPGVQLPSATRWAGAGSTSPG